MGEYYREPREPREPRVRGERDKDKVKIFRKKKCRFCVDKIEDIDFKQVGCLKRYVTERGKIMPRRITGNCAYHQRQLTSAIKIARNIALMPYSAR